jgi:FMN phosphatase YigB (HAD superfamily)
MVYDNYIFDLDDTLILCGDYYTEVKEKFTNIKARELGVSENLCYNVVADIDVNATLMPGAFSTNRFAKALYVASITLDLLCDRDINYDEAKFMESLGDALFTRHYDLLPYVLDTLTSLKSRGKNLFILTKGNAEVQMNKITQNKINTVIPLSNIKVVDMKSPYILSSFIKDHDLSYKNTVIVGDSVKDDIGSANVIGFDSILVTKTIDPGWQKYENIKYDSTYTVSNIREILHYVETHDRINN